VDHDVYGPLQDGVDSPPVGVLDVHLPLVAVRRGVETRVPRVPEMRIRDVGDPYYLNTPFKSSLFYPASERIILFGRS
jgi:hypothetical protein